MLGQKDKPQKGTGHIGGVEPAISKDVKVVCELSALAFCGKNQWVNNAIQESKNEHDQQGKVVNVPSLESPYIASSNNGQQDCAENVDNVNAHQG